MPTLLCVIYLVTLVIRAGLTLLNLRHRNRYGSDIPEEFAGVIDGDTLTRSSAYSTDNERFGLVRMLCSAAVVIAFLFLGGLGTYDRWVSAVFGTGWQHFITFFVCLHLLTSLLELPFDIYNNLYIEQRHGFNHMTVGLLLADWAKSTLLGAILVSAISACGYGLYRAAPNWYWLWFWGFALGLAVLLMLIAPTVIEPLFIKTKPLANDTLVAEVRELAARVGVKISQVLEVDASRRTAHSNAYFTGIGRVKRVVLFDNLLERLSDAELLAVLGHELGHWKLRHVTQRLVTTAASALVLFYVGSRLLTPEHAAWLLPSVAEPSLAARCIAVGFLASLAGFLFTPISAAWSRRHEWQADAFAARLTGQPANLARALVGLARDNLSNLHPHPWFAAFHYSHPPVLLRVRHLLKTEIDAQAR